MTDVNTSTLTRVFAVLDNIIIGTFCFSRMALSSGVYVRLVARISSTCVSPAQDAGLLSVRHTVGRRVDYRFDYFGFGGFGGFIS